VQLGLAIALLVKTHGTALQRALVLVIVALYCSALGRTWVVTGITRRRYVADHELRGEAEDGIT